MKIQPTPLYAVDRTGAFLAVIGWHESSATGQVKPVVVSLDTFGTPFTWSGDLYYLAEAPIVDHKVLEQTKPRPADAETEIIRAVPRNAQTGAPGWHGR